MKIPKNKAFTLVELLVVITILSIISVVAYQNFGGAVDKAVSGRKISDVSTIESSLAQYKVDKNYYPAVGVYSATTNLWGYVENTDATPSNTLDLTLDGEEIEAVNISGTDGGGKVYGSGSWARTTTAGSGRQIGAKGTISQAELGKQYLTKDLYDPEIGDLKESTNNKRLIDYGIGRYTYAVYRKPKGNVWGAGNNFPGTYYNIAYTLKAEGSDDYVTKIVGDYDEESCFDNANLCLNTLIGNQTNFLVDGQKQGETRDGTALTNFESTQANQGIPYPVE
ncbi:MAG: type II secretion system protein [Candidatus Gracilibacteria bacterium]|nr:type II secretion system protein [Candidatus Gracilibacteria bacterium]